MKPVLCIPSYSRPDGIAIERCKELPLKKFIFIRREQESLYDKWRPWYTLVLQDHGTDIGLVRKNIVNYCYKKGYEWAFMLDDDICKVEMLDWDRNKQCWNSKRIIEGSVVGPRFEIAALKRWFKWATRYDLALSCPIYRFNRGSKGTEIHINRHPVIQCVLIHVPNFIEVGNYKSIHVTGNEDYYIQFKLMRSGYKTGTIGLVEYDCPAVGNCDDGTNDTKDEKYRRYIQAFFTNVCGDPKYVTTKTTKTGFSSLNFVWKNFDQDKIQISLE